MQIGLNCGVNVIKNMSVITEVNNLITSVKQYLTYYIIAW